MAFDENVDAFFDTVNGFATVNSINGVDKTCIIGEVITGVSVITGAFVETMDITFKTADLDYPVKGQPMIVDGDRWAAGTVLRDPSVFTVTLERSES